MEFVRWGSTTANGDASNEVRIAKLTPISNDDCKREIDKCFDDKRCFIKPEMIESKLCAHGIISNDGTYVVPCRLDSGGPLLTLNGEYALGILSYGSAGCEDSTSTFTRISEFKDWILLNIV